MKIEIEGRVVFDELNTAKVTIEDLSFYAFPTPEDYPTDKTYHVPDNLQIRNLNIKSFDFE